MRRVPAFAAVLLAGALGALGTGCGGAEGVSEGATVAVYVSAPLRGPEGVAGRALCADAKAALARAGGGTAAVGVRVACLDAGGAGGDWTLAAVGADARRAAEDSTAVAYIGEPAPRAREQSHPILAAAGIAQLPGPSGASAMNEILEAIREAGSGDLRAAVLESVARG